MCYVTQWDDRLTKQQNQGLGCGSIFSFIAGPDLEHLTCYVLEASNPQIINPNGAKI